MQFNMYGNQFQGPDIGCALLINTKAVTGVASLAPFMVANRHMSALPVRHVSDCSPANRERELGLDCCETECNVWHCVSS